MDFKGVPCRDYSSSERKLQCSKLCASFLSLWLSDPLTITHTPLSKRSHLTIFYTGYKSTSPKLDTSFPGGSVVKNLPANARRSRFDPWMGKIPWRRKWQPSQVLLPGESHGQRTLVGYSPWGRKESDTTEQLSTAQKLTGQRRKSIVGRRLTVWATREAMWRSHIGYSKLDASRAAY